MKQIRRLAVVVLRWLDGVFLALSDWCEDAADGLDDPFLESLRILKEEALKSPPQKIIATYGKTIIRPEFPIIYDELDDINEGATDD